MRDSGAIDDGRTAALDAHTGCPEGLTKIGQGTGSVRQRDGDVSHHALPVGCRCSTRGSTTISALSVLAMKQPSCANRTKRSEEHTSELQSRGHLVCRLLL